jgi:hypothetical protein
MIMTCVRSATFSVLVNSNPMGRIYPTRGLRQGDPLSPYLFLLCAEGLSSMLLRAKNEGSISGVPISFQGTKLSHLFFADNSLLFSRANPIEWCNVQEVLKKYERASGQKLNANKTSIFFSRNTKRTFKDHIESLVGNSATPIITSIWDFQQWLVDQKLGLLQEFKIGFANGWMGGKSAFSLKRARKF